VPGEGPSGDQIDAVMRASRALVGIAAAAVAEVDDTGLGVNRS